MLQQKSVFLAIAGLCVLFAVPASAYDRRVVIVNRTSATMNEFYASSTGQRSWQEDILGGDVLGPGKTVRINVDDGTGYCKYDFRAVFDDGSESVQSGVNVCEVGKFTFRD
jgi:hypothetical protein